MPERSEMIVFDPPASVARPGTDEYTSMRDSATRLFEEVGPSVVGIRIDGRNMASGFFVDNRGGVLTNAHVVGIGREHQVVTANGTVYNARIERMNDIRDLALLRLDGVSASPAPPLVLNNRLQPDSNMRAYALGHPAGMHEICVSPGVIDRRNDLLSAITLPSSRRVRLDEEETAKPKPPPSREAIISNAVLSSREENRADLMRALNNNILEGRANIMGGNSGGPVVDEQGQVWGAVSSTFNATDEHFYVPSDDIQNLLDTPEDKFRFRYNYQLSNSIFNNYSCAWETNPVTTGVVSGGVLATGGGLATAYRSQLYNSRLMSAWGITAGALLACNEAANLYENGGFRNNLQDSLALASDAAIIGGSILRFTGRYRGLGTAILGLGASARLGTEFIPTRPVLQSIERLNDDPRPPINFSKESGPIVININGTHRIMPYGAGARFTR
ncbi:MAG: serine protease [Cyanobacteria bacterium]|nr:serine protease [Cyanobacteriota bacterium]